MRLSGGQTAGAGTQASVRGNKQKISMNKKKCSYLIISQLVRTETARGGILSVTSC